jgi:hypothetical protein
VKIQSASEPAIAAVQKASGSYESVKQIGRTKQEKTPK